MPFRLVTPDPDETRTTALQVITNAASFADDAASRLSAWAHLKSLRGQPMRLLHMARVERYQRHYAAPLPPVRAMAPATEAPFIHIDDATAAIWAHPAYFDGMAS